MCVCVCVVSAANWRGREEYKHWCGGARTLTCEVAPYRGNESRTDGMKKNDVALWNRRKVKLVNSWDEEGAGSANQNRL